MNGNCGSQNNVYIGARYVPKVVGDWSADVAYEPLTIVLYQGTSYTSITYVPKGIIPGDNTQQYWALTGNYNAQVELYRQEVEKIKNELDNINNLISKSYTNVNQMVNDQYLKNNNIVQTYGYNSINDGGSGTFIISNIPLETINIELNNGLYANLIPIDNIINPLSFGYTNINSWQNLIDFAQENKYTIKVPKSTYDFSNSTIYVNCDIDFNGSTINVNNAQFIIVQTKLSNANLNVVSLNNHAILLGYDGSKFNKITNSSLININISSPSQQNFNGISLECEEGGGFNILMENINVSNMASGIKIHVKRKPTGALAWLTGVKLNHVWLINNDLYGLEVLSDVDNKIPSPGQLSHSLFNDINVQTYNANSIGVLVSGGGNIYNITSLFDDTDRTKPITAIKYYDQVVKDGISVNGNIPMDYLIGGNQITIGMIEGNIDKGILGNYNIIKGYNYFDGIENFDKPINYFRNGSPLKELNMININKTLDYDKGYIIKPNEFTGTVLSCYLTKEFIKTNPDYFVAFVRIRSDEDMTSKVGFQLLSPVSDLVTRIGVTQFIKMNDGYIARAVFKVSNKSQWNLPTLVYTYLNVTFSGEAPTKQIIVSDIQMTSGLSPYYNNVENCEECNTVITLTSNQEVTQFNLSQLLGLQGYVYRKYNISCPYDITYKLNGDKLNLTNNVAQEVKVNVTVEF